MTQFNGDRQLTMFAPHTNAYMEYYYQTGPQPPKALQVNVVGKYMDEQKKPCKYDRHTYGVSMAEKRVLAKPGAISRDKYVAPESMGVFVQRDRSWGYPVIYARSHSRIRADELFCKRQSIR